MDSCSSWDDFKEIDTQNFSSTAQNFNYRNTKNSITGLFYPTCYKFNECKVAKAGFNKENIIALTKKDYYLEEINILAINNKERNTDDLLHYKKNQSSNKIDFNESNNFKKKNKRKRNSFSYMNKNVNLSGGEVFFN
jgi:hypothetical protein